MKLKNYIYQELLITRQNLQKEFKHDLNLIQVNLNKNLNEQANLNEQFKAHNLIANTNNKLLFKLGDYSYNRLYSFFRQNNFEFDIYYELLLNNKLTEKEKYLFEQICNFTIEEGIEKIHIVKAYNCLAIICSEKTNLEEKLKAIKNISYALDIMYIPQHALNLGRIITQEYEKQIISLIKEENLVKYFFGNTDNETAFLHKLIKLNIPDLTKKALYRLSMIHLLGRSSSLEQAKRKLKEAALELEEVIKLSNIKKFNILNILFVINDKYAPNLDIA